jgi:hypothetical protein
METFRTIVANSITVPQEFNMEQTAQDGAVQDIFPLALADLNTSLQYPAYWLQMDIPDNER